MAGFAHETQVVLHHAGPDAEVRVRGRFDRAVEAWVAAGVQAALRARPEALVVDLRGAVALDAADMARLATLWDQATTPATLLVVVSPDAFLATA